MNIYHYNPLTGKYAGKSIADESPLEEGVFLIPANATEVKVLDVIDGKIIKFFDGGWVYEDIPEKTLEELKQNKTTELDNACNMDICEGFYSTVDGIEYLWGFDEKTDQLNLNQMLSAIAAGIAPNEFYWKPKGELSPILIIIEQFKQMCVDAQTAKVSKIFNFWTLKAQVLACETKEEIASIVW